MNSLARGGTAILVLFSATALSACGADGSSQEHSFPYSGSSLSVTSEMENMPVSVQVRDGSAPRGQEVKVSVLTQTMGKEAKEPGWSLTKDTLKLGSPCGTSWVGYCEGHFTVTVPRGVAVFVNGNRVLGG